MTVGNMVYEEMIKKNYKFDLNGHKFEYSADKMLGFQVESKFEALFSNLSNDYDDYYERATYLEYFLKIFPDILTKFAKSVANLTLHILTMNDANEGYTEEMLLEALNIQNTSNVRKDLIANAEVSIMLGNENEVYLREKSQQLLKLAMFQDLRRYINLVCIKVSEAHNIKLDAPLNPKYKSDAEQYYNSYQKEKNPERKKQLISKAIQNYPLKRDYYLEYLQYGDGDGGLQTLGEFFESVDIDFTKALYLYRVVIKDRKKEQYRLYLRENRDKLSMSSDAVRIYEDAF